MATKVTKAMSKKYMKDGKCPFCGSKNIESYENMQVDGKDAWLNMQCNMCYKLWQEEYKLTGITKWSRN
jgi:transcription elongation factor Elf1